MFDNSIETVAEKSRSAEVEKAGPAYYVDLIRRFIIMGLALAGVVLLTHTFFNVLLDLPQAGKSNTIEFASTPIDKAAPQKPIAICGSLPAPGTLARQNCTVGFTAERIAASRPLFTLENEAKAVAVPNPNPKLIANFRATWQEAFETAYYRQWMRSWFFAMYIGFLAALFSFFMGEAIYRKAEAEYRASGKSWKIPFVSPALNETLTRTLPRAFVKALPSQIGALFVGLGTLVAMTVLVVKERFDLDPQGPQFSISDENWNENANIFRIIYDTTPWGYNSIAHQGYFIFLSILLLLTFISPIIVGFLVVENTLPNKFGVSTKTDGLDRRIKEVADAISKRDTDIVAKKKALLDEVAIHFPDIVNVLKLDHPKLPEIDFYEPALALLKADASALHEQIGLHLTLKKSVEMLARDMAAREEHLKFEVSRECGTATCPVGAFQTQADSALIALKTCEASLKDAIATLVEKIRCFELELAAKLKSAVTCDGFINDIHKLQGEKETLQSQSASLLKEKAAREDDKAPIIVENDKLSLKHARYEGEHDFETLDKEVRPSMVVDFRTVLAFAFSTIMLIIFGNLLLAPELKHPLTYSATSAEMQIVCMLLSPAIWLINLLLVASFLILTALVYYLLPKFMAKTFWQRMANFALFGVLAAGLVWLGDMGARIARPLFPEAIPGPYTKLEIQAPPAEKVAPVPHAAKPLEFVTLACNMQGPGKGGAAFVFNRPSFDPVMVDPSRCQLSQVDAEAYNYYIVVGMASEEGGATAGNLNLAEARAKTLWSAINTQVKTQPIKVYWYNRGVHACTRGAAGECMKPASTKATDDQRLLIVIGGYDPEIAKRAGAGDVQQLQINSPASREAVETKLNALDLGSYENGSAEIKQNAIIAATPATK